MGLFGLFNKNKKEVLDNGLDEANALKDELKAAQEAEDVEAMKTKKDELSEKIQALTVKLYEQAAQEAEGQADAGDSSDNDGDVDADFEEVNDDK